MKLFWKRVYGHQQQDIESHAGIYDASKNYLTMYGYSGEGDIGKRDLAPGDIAGIQAVFRP